MVATAVGAIPDYFLNKNTMNRTDKTNCVARRI